MRLYCNFEKGICQKCGAKQTRNLKRICDKKRTPGVGTILKKFFARLHLKPWRGCNCNNIALEMDQVGPNYIEKNIEKYIKRMQKNVPGVPAFILRRIILYAIKKERQYVDSIT